jgi:hypothetical protein
MDPVVGGAGIIPGEAADEGAVFHPGHIARVRARQVAVGTFYFVQFPKGAALHQQVAELIIFLLGTVTPVNTLGFA